MRVIVYMMAGAVVVGASAVSPAAEPPLLLPEDGYNNLVTLPDGRIWRLDPRNVIAQGGLGIYYSESTDNGLTWTGGENTPQWRLVDALSGWNPVPVVDLDGNLHLFQLTNTFNDGTGSRNDLHHFQVGLSTEWDRVHIGFSGSVMKAIVTSTGRLVVPFGDSYEDPPPGHGNFRTLVRSRAAGSTIWELSDDELISPVPSNWNGVRDGACEPTIIELTDGRLWMLMRSQTGKLTESYSDDGGLNWTPAVNSNFYTTTGPPSLTRLNDGRLMLIWNNGTMPQRYKGRVWYAGRDALHAAISDDDGKTWRGFREIYLDPFRNQNPTSGDSGTAYPFATPTADNHVLAIVGQAAARTMLRIDPDWLLETDQSDDFTAPDAMDRWSVFKSYGNVGDPAPVKRSREVGAVLIDDPDPARDKPVLHIRRPNEHDPDGATWNFPMAARGQTTVRLKLQEGFGGGVIALTDRFFAPTDNQGEDLAFYRLDLPASGVLPGGTQLQSGEWYDVVLDWNTLARKAVVRVDGEAVGVIDAQAGIETWPGLSYLRLRSAATTIDTAGYLVDRVAHMGSGFRDGLRVGAAEAEAALSGPDDGWTRIRFDDYVPNQNASETNTSGNGQVASFAGRFLGFVNPTGGAAAVGLVIESSTGTVAFTDGTSAQITSDVLGAKDGETLTLRFVDPDDPTRAAVVAEVALRLGSMEANNVEVRLLDVNGEELPDWAFAALPGGLSRVTGFRSMIDLEVTPLIHAIEFTAAGSDTWLLGSFNADPALFDLAFTGFEVVPEPGTLALAGVGAVLAGLRAPRRRD